MMIIFARDSALIARHEARRTLASVRALALLVLFVLFSTFVALATAAASRGISTAVDAQIAQGQPDATAEERAQLRAQLDAEFQSRRGEFLAVWFSADPELLAAVKDVPVFLLVLFKLSLLFLPAYVALLGYDAISAELATRGLRYVVVRTARGAVLLGKFAGLAAVLLALVGGTQGLVIGWAAATDADFSAGAALATWARFSLSGLTYALSWLALTLLCSNLFRVPMVSLAVNGMAMFGLWLADLVGSVSAGSQGTGPLSWLRYASPTHYAGDLLHPALSRFGMSALACMAFAALMLAAAGATLRARDV
jgi:ABC-2 type transport system permease protein